MDHLSKLEKIWLWAAIFIIISASILLAFRFPHPFDYHEYPPDYHWFDLTLRSSFLRFSELPGLATPLTSAPVKGLDYIYTSQNNAFQLFYLILLKPFSWLINLDNAFVFLVASRILMIIINIAAFYSLYLMLALIFPRNKFSSKLICLMLFASWPIYSYLEVSRWMPLLILLLSWSLYFSIKYLRTENRNELFKLILFLLPLSFIHYFGSAFALSIAILLLFLSKQNRAFIVFLIFCAAAGSFVEIFLVYYYSAKYGKIGSRETGFSHLIYYAKTWFGMWREITLASLGKTKFHLNLHGTIPNMMSDFTTSVIPSLPDNLFKTREAFGLQWSRWSTVHGETKWYAYQLAIAGFIVQIIYAFFFFAIFFGAKFFGKIKLMANNLKNEFSQPLTGNKTRKFLLLFCVIYLLVYIFVFFRIEPELYARYGFLAPLIALALGYFMTYSSNSRALRVARIVFLSVFVFMSMSFQINREFIKPHSLTEFEAYKRLVEWSAKNINNRVVYFDFSNYYYLPAKLLIDAPMPFGEYAFPNNTNSFKNVYSENNTFVIGISADIALENDKEINKLLVKNSAIKLIDIPSREIGIYYMPARPNNGVIKLEYVERIELAEKNKVLYFYAGELNQNEAKIIQ